MFIGLVCYARPLHSSFTTLLAFKTAPSVATISSGSAGFVNHGLPDFARAASVAEVCTPRQDHGRNGPAELSRYSRDELKTCFGAAQIKVQHRRVYGKSIRQSGFGICAAFITEDRIVAVGQVSAQRRDDKRIIIQNQDLETINVLAVRWARRRCLE